MKDKTICYWKGSQSIEKKNKYYSYCNGSGCDGYTQPAFCDRKLSQSDLEKKLQKELT